MPTISNATQKLDWNAKGLSRIVQNAQNLLLIGFYENAFDRTMGNDALDSPDMTDLTEEIYRNFSEYLPDVEIVDIRAASGEQGNVSLEVDISIE